MNLNIIPFISELFDQNTGSLKLYTDHEAITLLFHSIMLKLDFKWQGLSETGPNIASTIYDETSNKITFPKDWNKSNSQDGELSSFRYAHKQSTFTFLLKLLKISDFITIYGLAIEDKRLHSINVPIKEIIKSEPEGRPSYPIETVDPSLNGEEWIYKNLDKWITEFRVNIIQKLIPNLYKPGYEEIKPETPNTGSGGDGRDGSSTFPLPPQPLFSDPSRFGRPQVPFQPIAPFGEYGRADWDPFTPMTPSSGMIAGSPPYMPFHQDNSTRPGLPPGSVPPGARFDPFEPFDPLRSENSGVRFGLPGSLNIPRNPSFPNTGERGNDEFMPPEEENIFGRGSSFNSRARLPNPPNQPRFPPPFSGPFM